MSPNGIALVYGACLLVGFIYSAMQFVFGAHHGVDTGGHGGIDVGHHGFGGHAVDLGHHAGHVGHAGHDAHVHGTNLEDGTAPQTVSFLNPLTIGTWITTFGGFGLIFLALFKSPAISAVLSGVTSFGATLIAFYLFLHLLIQPEVVRNMIPEETVGLTGEVTVSIPPDGSTLGQVAYILDAKRFIASARSEDGAEIPKGAEVRVVGINGQTATVRRLDAPPSAADQDATTPA